MRPPHIILCALSLAGCAVNAWKPPQISYDELEPAVLETDPPKPVEVVEVPKLLPLPGQLKPLPGKAAAPEAKDPKERVANANDAARVQPTRHGYLNAVQVYPFADGALYQVYAAPGEVTDIALQAGEQLVGSGPVAAGDTVRWVIGDTESGAGASKRIHILAKPTRPDLVTNLVINTDRRTYLLELRSTEKTYMASVSWQYPQDQLIALRRQADAAEAAAPIDSGIDIGKLRFRYAIEGDNPPWRPTQVFDDGSKVPAALITGIRSDLPGEITAQVTENVYDSPSGKFLLIPQGARLIGQYDSQISFGQSRVLLAWTRIIMPNGTSIVLERQPGADSAGYAGLEDDVDYHWGNLLKAAAISTLLGISSELVLNSNNAVVEALRTGTENTVNQTGQTLVSRQLNVQPTLTIRPGFPVRVVVNRDLVFVPYKG